MLALTRGTLSGRQTLRPPSHVIPRRLCTTKSVTLHGEASSTGFMKGRACVITNPDDETQEEKLRFGDVLVCKLTNDRWNSLISSASAVVIELGGKISHGPMVARRIGIPCVSNLPSSMWDYIKDGDEVIVRGTVGTVEILGKEEIPGKPLQIAPDDDAHTISPEELAELQNSPEKMEEIMRRGNKA